MSVEENKAMLSRIYDECFNAHDLSAMDKYFAPDYIEHSPEVPQPLDLQGFKNLFGMYLSAFPDARFTIEAVMGEGDMLAWRDTFTGTHQGELMGIPPTGKRISVTGVHYGRARDGMAVEHWAGVDTLGMLQQLGIVPMMGAAPAGAGT
ncbi:MAG TPA: ester cyclase [Chloroflexia bacterium]